MAVLPNLFAEAGAGLYGGMQQGQARLKQQGLEADTKKQYAQEQLQKIAALDMSKLSPQQRQVFDELAQYHAQIAGVQGPQGAFEAGMGGYDTGQRVGDVIGYGNLASRVTPESGSAIWGMMPPEFTGGKPAPQITSAPTGSTIMTNDTAVWKTMIASAQGDQNRLMDVAKLIMPIAMRTLESTPIGSPERMEVEQVINDLFARIGAPSPISGGPQGQPGLPPMPGSLNPNQGLTMPRVSLGNIPTMTDQQRTAAAISERGADIREKGYYQGKYEFEKTLAERKRQFEKSYALDVTAETRMQATAEFNRHQAALRASVNETDKQRWGVQEIRLIEKAYLDGTLSEAQRNQLKRNVNAITGEAGAPGTPAPAGGGTLDATAKTNLTGSAKTALSNNNVRGRPWRYQEWSNHIRRLDASMAGKANDALLQQIWTAAGGKL